MSTTTDSTIEKLAAMIAQQVATHPQPQTPQVGMSPFGMPTMPTGLAASQPVGGFQVAGVSVPVTVPLPDGRELSVRIHFGPESAQNLQALAAYCSQAFGPYLQARSPYRGGYGGNGSWSRYGRR